MLQALQLIHTESYGVDIPELPQEAQDLIAKIEKEILRNIKEGTGIDALASNLGKDVFLLRLYAAQYLIEFEIDDKYLSNVLHSWVKDLKNKGFDALQRQVSACVNIYLDTIENSVLFTSLMGPEGITSNIPPDLLTLEFLIEISENYTNQARKYPNTLHPFLKSSIEFELCLIAVDLLVEERRHAHLDEFIAEKLSETLRDSFQSFMGYSKSFGLFEFDLDNNTNEMLGIRIVSNVIESKLFNEHRLEFMSLKKELNFA